ncbi:DNA replication initiation factor cdc45 [Coemansia sp. RSA 552]|nr:DNA replication initiation factor cdc45 [Coemansia sp. RSA 552]
MVFVPGSSYELAYRRLVDNSGVSGTVLVFVAMDVDALCALRILIMLLKRDAVAHKIIPVRSYAEIGSLSQTLVAANPQIKSVVLLNCGAQADIQEFVTLREGLELLIVDSHRPFNLYNVFWHEQVQCLDDGDVERVPELRQAFEAVEFADGSDSEASFGESDEEDADVGSKRKSDDSDDAGPQRRRRRTKHPSDPAEFLQLQERRAQRREERARYQQMVQQYYLQGAYFGQSCALSTLAMAEQLGMPAHIDSAWCAIVGAASQHLLQQIDADGYALVVRRMRDLVHRVCPPPTNNPSSGSKAGGMATEDTRHPNPLHLSSSSDGLLSLDSQLNPNGADVSEVPNIDPFNPMLEAIAEEDDEGYLRARAGVSTNAEAGLLTSSRSIALKTEVFESSELKFPLLRHWSLDSSMRFSPYVSTRLATWSAKGRARLDLLLAKLGLSKAEASAPFLHLHPDLKRQLYRKMAEIGKDYDMPDAMHAGFVRNYGWRKSLVSSNDMVLSLLALLQRDTWHSEDDEVKLPKATGFFTALDALSHFPQLKAGLGGAQKLQRLVVGQGISMLERQAVKTLRLFRLAILADDDDTTAGVFATPFALRQLALFLMQTLRERTKKAAQARLPFIIASPLPAAAEDAGEGAEQTLLVLGITPLDYSLLPNRSTPFSKSSFSGESRNHFGLIFEQVAAETGADVTQGFFDSSAMHIARQDMSAFVDRLRRHL